jgi:AraC-like DNA-binding protein
MRETTVAASIAIDMAVQLEQLGFPREDVCRRARIDPALLTRPHDRLPGSAAERLWAVAEQLTGDSLLGLHVAERYRTGAISILGHVFLNCSTVGEALERLARFGALLNDGLRVRIDREGGQVVVRMEATEGLDNFLLTGGRHVFETMAAGIVLTMRRMSEGPFIPAAVWFRHPAAGDVAEYHRIFGTLVRFGMAEHRLAFHADDLSAPIPAADASLLTLFEGHALGRLRELEELQGVSQRVLALISTRLTGAVPSLPSLARELAMSGRHLQRTLKEEGTTYQELLDTARRERAMLQLARPGATAAEVALLLGYSEAGAFTRAFKRWTGTTPGAFAAAQGDD